MPSKCTAIVVAPSAGLGGGVERYLGEVCRAIEAAGASVDVVSAGSGGSYGFGMRAKVRLVVAGLQSARAGRGRPTVVICGSAGFVPLCWLMAKVAGASNVTFFYGQEIWTSGPISRAIWKRMAGTLVTISNFSAGALATVGVPRIIRPHVPPGDWSATHDDRPWGALRVTTVCRLDDWRAKAVDGVIAGCAILVAEGNELELVVAGRGPAPAQLRAEVEDLAWVTLCESPDDDELRQVYEKSDVFVLSTPVRTTGVGSGEGFGIVLAEAAFAGCCLVGPPPSGSSDLVIHDVTGLSLPSPAPQHVAAALRRLSSDGLLRRRLASAAGEHVRAICSSEIFEGAVADLLAAVTSQRSN